VLDGRISKGAGNGVLLHRSQHPDGAPHIGVQHELERVVAMTTTLVAGAATGGFDQLDTVTANVNETLERLAGLAGCRGRIGEWGGASVQEGQVIWFPE
jgi:hypothetical protein